MDKNEFIKAWIAGITNSSAYGNSDPNESILFDKKRDPNRRQSSSDKNTNTTSASFQYDATGMFREWVWFRLLHPLNREPYAGTLENFKRWRHMNVEARAIKTNINALPKITVDNSLLLKIRRIYGVQRFEQFPAYTQAVYSAVAKRFPGSQVYACGSRVRGDYVDADEFKGGVLRTIHQLGEEQVIFARKAAGMKARAKSDYDFWVEPGANQVGDLPENTDRCRLRIPENEKVPIPIYYGKD